MSQPLSSPSSPSPTQTAVIRTVVRFGQASASQLRRLHYAGTPRGVAVRSSRHLKRLTEQGLIRRLPYKLMGWGFGSGEFVYTAPDSKARIPNLHMLDVTELYVRLMEESWNPVYFEPEPWSHSEWGGVRLKPNAYVRVGGRHYFVELDRGTEFAAALSGQINKYVSAFYGMDGGSFPQVLWVAHDADRAAFIRREAAKKRVSGLLEVELFQETARAMLA
jgi:hypothetical protein